jgi:putative ABC transport system substrate-binding protein
LNALIKGTSYCSTKIKKIPFFLLLFLVLASHGVAYCNEKTIAVIVSKKIKPYMQVLKGVEQGINHEMDIYFLNQDMANQKKIKQKLINKSYDLFLSIGPEATSFIYAIKSLDNKVKIFSALLDVHKIIGKENNICGISLQIPVHIQLREISTALPKTKNIGLLFNQKNNQPFFIDALASSKEQGLNLIPLSVNSKKEIPDILKKNLNRIDCVWMIPDQTVISEKIVQYVIKQSLYLKKGVIGYNSFFLKSGAVFAFLFNYIQIGIQTADTINNYFIQGQCGNVAPIFERRINLKVAHTLDIQLISEE